MLLAIAGQTWLPSFVTAVEGAISRAVMSHTIQSPSVFDYHYGYPLRFLVNDKHDGAKDKRDGIDDKECDIKELLMAGPFLVIGDI